MRTLVTVIMVSTVLWVCGGGSASAQIQGIRPEGHFNLSRGIDVGVGGRIDIPLVPQGFISTVNDELAISPGIDLLVGEHDAWFAIPVPLQWNFYLQQDWSLFPELGIALLFGDHGRGRDNVDIDIVLKAGARYHFSSRNALVVRIGWPVLLQVGMTF